MMSIKRWLVIGAAAWLGVWLAPAAHAAATAATAGQTPAVTPESGTLPFNNGSYRESTVTYKGKTAATPYWFVTYNKNGTSYTNGQTVYVTFDGAQGSVSTTGLADNDTVFAATVIVLNDSDGDGRAEYGNSTFVKANSTIFVDSGTYYGSAYTSLSAENLSIIGLTDINSGDPVIFTPTTLTYGWGGSSTATNPTTIQTNATERYVLSNQGLMWQNFIIDADGASVLHGNGQTKPSTLSSYWTYNNSTTPDDDGDPTTGKLGWIQSTSGNGSTDRGEFLIWMSSASGTAASPGALLKNITVRNVGPAHLLKGSVSSFINGGFAVDPRCVGQNNLENVTFENIAGNNFGTTSYRIMMLKEVPNLNIKNLTIKQDSSLYATSWNGGTVQSTSQPIWEEIGTASYDTGAAVTSSDIRFAGTLTISGYDDPALLNADSFPAGSKPLTYERITLGSNAFGNFTVPEGYRYAVFNVGTYNGTSSSSSSSGYSGQIYLYKSLSNFRQVWGASTNNQQVVFDMEDNSWLVRQPESGVNDATVNNQLTGIATVLRRLAQTKNTSTSGGQNANGRSLLIDAYIKIVPDATGKIPSFTVPNYQYLTSTTPNVHIRAVSSPADLFSGTIDAPAATAGTTVAFKAGETITLTATTNANVRLYNFDFHTGANYTLHEAATGTTAKVAGSAVNTFVSCRFTALVQDIALSVPAALESNTTDDDDGDTYVVNLGLSPFTPVASVSEAYTYPDTGYQHMVPSASNFAPDDDSMIWSSNDPAVATVDPATGKVTLVAAGTAIITATAKDSYNQGEIPRPSASFTLDVRAGYTVIYDGNGADNTSVPVDNNSYAQGAMASALGNVGPDGSGANPLVRAGYTFLGWSTNPLDTTAMYGAGATFAMPGNNVTLYAIWRLAAAGAAPIPTTDTAFLIALALLLAVLAAGALRRGRA